MAIQEVEDLVAQVEALESRVTALEGSRSFPAPSTVRKSRDNHKEAA